MRRAIVILLSVIFGSALFYSCNKDGKTMGFSQSSSQLIAGRWALQQEKVVQYVNGVINTDTTYNTSSNNVASIQFNKDGTYYSISLYSSNQSIGSLNPGGITTADSTAGVFTFAGTKFSVSAPITGLGSSSFAFGGVTSYTTVAVFAPVSNSIEITQLTSNRLSLHTENIYTLTNNNVTQTYKNECDYYYTK